MQTSQFLDHSPDLEVLEDISRMSRVFQHLLKYYAQSIRAWTRFVGDGDSLYFNDLRSHPLVRDSMTKIEACLEKLSDLEHIMSLKERDCTAAANVVSSRDGNEQLSSLTYVVA